MEKTNERESKELNAALWIVFGFGLCTLFVTFLFLINPSHSSPPNFEVGNFTFWNQNFTARLPLKCTQTDEQLYLYFNRNCTATSITGVLKDCAPVIACAGASK